MSAPSRDHMPLTRRKSEWRKSKDEAKKEFSAPSSWRVLVPELYKEKEETAEKVQSLIKSYISIFFVLCINMYISLCFHIRYKSMAETYINSYVIYLAEYCIFRDRNLYSPE